MLAVLDVTAKIVTLLIGFCNLCILAYGFKMFLGKPTNNLKDELHELVEELKERIAVIESKIDEHQRSLNAGSDDFREIRQSLEVLQNCMSVIVDFEISFCDRMNYEGSSEEIIQARKDLREFSARK